MKQEDRLKEEVEFWLSYVNDWKNNKDEPVPKRALSLLDNALIKLNGFYSEQKQDKSLQNLNPPIH